MKKRIKKIEDKIKRSCFNRNDMSRFDEMTEEELIKYIEEQYLGSWFESIKTEQDLENEFNKINIYNEPLYNDKEKELIREAFRLSNII